jgi:hypothetical protein
MPKLLVNLDVGDPLALAKKGSRRSRSVQPSMLGRVYGFFRWFAPLFFH